MGFSLYLLFVIAYFIHLTSRIPVLGSIRFELVLMIIITLFVVIDIIQRKSPLWDLKTVNRLMLFTGLIVFSLPFVQWPGSVLHGGLVKYVKVVPFFFFTVILVNTERRIKIFMFVFILCQTFRILEPAYLHWTTGYWGSVAHSMVGDELSRLDRLSGAPDDVINPNQLAWVIVGTIPFFYYLCWRNGIWLSLASIAVLPVFIYALLLTGSRSGLLSLFVLIMAMAWLGKGKFKRLVVGSLLLISLTLIVADELSPDLKMRYQSIIDQSVIGGDTVMGRFEGMKRDLSTVWNRPIFGHGFATGQEVNANYLGSEKITHDLYIEILQEVGIVGFIVFGLYILEVIRSLIEARRILSDLPPHHMWLINLITATQAWIAMHLFYSLTCYGLRSWELYLFGGIAAACLRLARAYSLEKSIEDDRSAILEISRHDYSKDGKLVPLSQQ
jgi:O-Antigen ligase